MRWPHRNQGLVLFASILLMAALAVTGCGGAVEDEANAPFTISVEQTYLTIGNRSGSAFSGGLIELVPSGVLAPYKMQLPRIESGATRDVPFDRFSGVGGAQFRRGVTRIKAVRVTATDMSGTTHKREVPFN